MATTTIGAPGVTFPDGSVQSSKGSSGDVVMNVYTSSSTWTKPATVKSIKVTVVGGGGTGGTASRGALYPAGLTSTRNGALSGGGGGGGYSQRTYPASSIPGPQPFTVGGAASTSSFGGTVTVISATGGSNGGSATGAPGPAASTAYGAGGAGGAGSNGFLNIPGSTGGSGQRTLTGGSSVLSQVAEYSVPTGPSTNGYIYGGGGSGADTGAGPAALTLPGGSGAQGVVIVEEFY